MPRLKSDLKSLVKPPSLNEEEFDIGEYLNNKLVQNAQMTSQIKSTLGRLDTKFGGKRGRPSVISENNSSEEDNKDDEA